jgi:hypothetical protein
MAEATPGWTLIPVMDWMADHRWLEGWGVHLAGNAYSRLQAAMGDDGPLETAGATEWSSA